MTKQSPIIIKASGEKVPFDAEKLRRSLQRTGAAKEQIASILTTISGSIHEGMRTKEIYQLAFKLLKQGITPFAARYKLKNAIMELGPSGFPFERYVSELMKNQGYKVRVGEIVRGQCVSHEIDVIVEKGNSFDMIECKFHNMTGISCDVKIPLYIKSRFDDVAAAWKTLSGHEKLEHNAWVFTNTKFTSDAIQYGQCAGLKLVGWNFPEQGNLKQLIDQSGLHPITCLTTMTGKEKQILLEKGIVLCKEILNKQAILELAQISKERQSRIIRETTLLCDQDKLG